MPILPFNQKSAMAPKGTQTHGHYYLETELAQFMTFIELNNSNALSNPTMFSPIQ